MEKAFHNLKEAVSKGYKLYHIDYDHPLILQCDASDTSAGMCILQYIDDQIRVNHFHSVKFPRQARKTYSIVIKECLAILLGIEKYRVQLEAARQRFIVTDSMALVFILSAARAGNSRLTRLAMTLMSLPFHVIVKHRSGSDNIIPDTLSRLFHKEKTRLKLKQVNTIDVSEIKGLDMEEGQITTLDEINGIVKSDDEFIRPFLQNPNSLYQVGKGQLVEEIFMLDEEIFDNPHSATQSHHIDSEESTPYYNGLESVGKQCSTTIHNLSMAAKEVKWETIVKAQSMDAVCSKLIETVVQRQETTGNFKILNGLLMKKTIPIEIMGHTWKQTNNDTQQFRTYHVYTVVIALWASWSEENTNGSPHIILHSQVKEKCYCIHQRMCYL